MIIELVPVSQIAMYGVDFDSAEYSYQITEDDVIEEPVAGEGE